MKKIKTVGKFIFSLLYRFILFSLILSAVLIPFYEFKVISSAIYFIIAICLSFIIALVIEIIKGIRKPAETKFSLWYQKHKANFGLICMLLFFFASSVNSSIIFTQEKLISFVSIQWAMFAITTTMFIVWTAIVSKFLKDREPKIEKESTVEQELLYKLQKKSFYADIVRKTTSLIFVVINVLVLFITTGMVYVFNQEVTIIAQTAVIFSFYVSGNALLQILIDMTIPFFETSIELQMDNDIKADEINSSMFLALLKNYAEECLSKIKNDKTLSLEEKNKKIDEFQINFRKAVEKQIEEKRTKKNKRVCNKK